MTYTQRLDKQITFAREKMLEAEQNGLTRELDTWNGYRQGLRYAQAELEGFGYQKEPSLKELVSKGSEAVTDQCQCDQQDLQPLGECICGGDKVAPV